MDGIVEWARNLLWDEIVVRYVVPGVVLVIGTLLFGRRYKSRIRSLEAQVARIPGLETQVTRIAGLETQVTRIAGLETQVARIQQPGKRDDEVPTVWVRYALGSRNGSWQEEGFPVGPGLTHHLQFKDDGGENVIQISKAYRLVFVDPKASRLWGDYIEGDLRFYRSGPFDAGYGLGDVFVMIEPADST